MFLTGSAVSVVRYPFEIPNATLPLSSHNNASDWYSSLCYFKHTLYIWYTH